MTDGFLRFFNDLNEEEKKGITAAYYNSVEYLDKNIGMVINHLEKEGILEKTLIIYLGDHGYLLNHHKRFEKTYNVGRSSQCPSDYSGSWTEYES